MQGPSTQHSEASLNVQDTKLVLGAEKVAFIFPTW